VIRAVLDTVIFVRALIRTQSRWGQLLFDHAVEYQLVTSPSIIVEYLEVLRRPELVRKYPTVEGRDIRSVLNFISVAESVVIDNFPAVCRDPEDDKFLATAVAGRASMVVSEDRDLLILDDYQGIQIVTAKDFLEKLTSK
jgi:putative PIN family toxin of toxin-antitoxin system